MDPLPSSSFFILLFHLFLTTASATEDFDTLVPFGANQKFFATSFDRDAIETSISEHSTSTPSSVHSSENAQRAFNNMQRSVLDTPHTEWMSTTDSSYQADDQPSESRQQPEQTTGEKPPVKDNNDFVLLFSHAIEIPLARTPQSIIDSNSDGASSSSSLRHSLIHSEDKTQVQEDASSHQAQKQDINEQKAQLVQKKYQEVPVIFHSIPASSYEAPDPFAREASPSQPLVRMYSYMVPAASASNQEQAQYPNYIPPSSYRPEPVSNDRPTYEKAQNYPTETIRPIERPVTSQKVEKKFVGSAPNGYSTGSAKFIPLSASYRAPVLPFYPSMPQYGMPRPTVKNVQNHQSSQNVPQFFPQSLTQMSQVAAEPMSQKSPIASSSSAIRSLSNLPFFPRLFHLHQLLGGRRWL